MRIRLSVYGIKPFDPMHHLLDLEKWARKEHFHFFRKFEEPFFGVCVPIDCTRAYQNAKAQNSSFFLYYLHKSLVAANGIEPFRYRIAQDRVLVHDQVHASPTINRPDGTFGFGYIYYREAFEAFAAAALIEIDNVRSSNELIPAVAENNFIHYSSIPWLNFTSLSHARSFSFNDSCPKISFGKITETGNQKTMPVSIHVHHALMDGFHVGLFVDEFQKLMNE